MNDCETLADIVAEKRRMADQIEDFANGKPNQFQRDLIADLRAEADRIEAAAKRATTEKSSAVGNAAKLREALKQAKVAILVARKKMGVDNPIILEIIDTALAAPARNCDVGTAEEQNKRLCSDFFSVRQCGSFTRTALEWGQMPYEEGSAK